MANSKQLKSSTSISLSTLEELEEENINNDDEKSKIDISNIIETVIIYKTENYEFK